MEQAARELRFDEIQRCPVCDCAHRRHKFASADLLHGVKGLFSYVECTDCHTVYQNPRVTADDLSLCYPVAYFTHSATVGSGEGSLAPPGSIRDRLRRAIRLSADKAPSSGLSKPMRWLGRLMAMAPAFRRRARYGLIDELATTRGGGERCLEIGPGQGTMLRALKWIGWNAIGLDVDRSAAEVARSTSGCDVKVGSITNVSFESPFQMIYMSHVVEHLPHLKESLKRCLELLLPGGRLILFYPNPDGLTAKRHGKYSCIWDPPRHLALPPLKAMARLLEMLGYDSVQSATTAQSAVGYRVVARQYQAGCTGQGLIDHPPALSDRIFGLGERVLVALGAPVGEEIFIVAYKGQRVDG